jgi:hypothetical protein
MSARPRKRSELASDGPASRQALRNCPFCWIRCNLGPRGGKCGPRQQGAFRLAAIAPQPPRRPSIKPVAPECVQGHRRCNVTHRTFAARGWCSEEQSKEPGDGLCGYLWRVGLPAGRLSGLPGLLPGSGPLWRGIPHRIGRSRKNFTFSARRAVKNCA